MIRHHEFDGAADRIGRVDAIASALFGIPRTVFSYPSIKIRINDSAAKKSSKVNTGDYIDIEYDEEVLEGLEAESIPLNIVYEDSSILIIDKDQDMAVHPGAGNYTGTVANALLGLYGDDFNVGDDSIRPGIVHRLDKDTSGILIIAKTQHAHKSLSEQFAMHTNEKYYDAIVKGQFLSSSGRIDSRIKRDPKDRKKYTVTENKSEGKSALTEFRVISQSNGYAFLRIRIYTGRTHQIRVHMASIGHPVLGDPIYSKKDRFFPDATLMLTSASLTITHPESGERMTFSSPVPERFLKVMKETGLKDKKPEKR